MALKLDFFDRPTNITAKVICDSISEAGQRITTFEIEYPRFILAELNTHKMLEKNSSSSRAIPIIRMIEQIDSNMAVPLYWGKAKSGMQADDEVDAVTKLMAETSWQGDFNRLKESAIWMDDMFIHKQIANRLLEPFQMMKTVITGTDWDNFFNLRIHPDAQPEFCMLAYKMYVAMQESKPVLLREGEWHLPYVSIGWNSKGEIAYFDADFNVISLEQAQRISASCCAQTSYRKSDDSLEKADKVFDLLVKADVLHASPFGHLATPIIKRKDVPFDDGLWMRGKILMNTCFPESWENGITHMNRNGVLCSGNLTGWISYRHLIPNNTCYDFNFEERMELFK